MVVVVVVVVVLDEADREVGKVVFVETVGPINVK